ncbi:MAG: hypothetical protein IPK95_13675 [Cellvibrionales bacterium]|nr:hypothetical protein [Cellvibrionales bacterium]
MFPNLCIIGNDAVLFAQKMFQFAGIRYERDHAQFFGHSKTTLRRSTTMTFSAPKYLAATAAARPTGPGTKYHHFVARHYLALIRGMHADRQWLHQRTNIKIQRIGQQSRLLDAPAALR